MNFHQATKRAIDGEPVRRPTWRKSGLYVVAEDQKPGRRLLMSGPGGGMRQFNPNAEDIRAFDWENRRTGSVRHGWRLTCLEDGGAPRDLAGVLSGGVRVHSEASASTMPADMRRRQGQRRQKKRRSPISRLSESSPPARTAGAGARVSVSRAATLAVRLCLAGHSARWRVRRRYLDGRGAHTRRALSKRLREVQRGGNRGLDGPAVYAGLRRRRAGVLLD